MPLISKAMRGAQKPILVHDYSNYGMVNGEPLGSGGVTCAPA